MAKVRLIMRKWISDANGNHVGYEYSSEVVEILAGERPEVQPEIVGGEYLTKWDKE